MFAWALLLMQVNVLLIAAVHHHGLIGDLFQRQPVVTAASGPSGAAGQTAFCMTCQIVRQGAARPALATPARQPDSPVLFIATSNPPISLSVERVVVYGRAPPLA
jgi:hypothetical protein